MRKKKRKRKSDCIRSPDLDQFPLSIWTNSSPTLENDDNILKCLNCAFIILIIFIFFIDLLWGLLYCLKGHDIHKNVHNITQAGEVCRISTVIGIQIKSSMWHLAVRSADLGSEGHIRMLDRQLTHLNSTWCKWTRSFLLQLSSSFIYFIFLLFLWFCFFQGNWVEFFLFYFGCLSLIVLLT